LDKNIKINKNSLVEKYPFLQDTKASFVTLNIDGRLRGCIGSLVACQSLFDDIYFNAKKAAFSDPRFAPLSKNEFYQITIDVSILTRPERIIFDTMDELKKIIRPKVDGIIIKQNSKQATFLPQVWDQLPDFDMFMNNLFKKANIVSLKDGLDVYNYQVNKISI
jgi:AmmeMemoRadiSam system protein A